MPRNIFHWQMAYRQYWPSARESRRGRLAAPQARTSDADANGLHVRCAYVAATALSSPEHGRELAVSIQTAESAGALLEATHSVRFLIETLALKALYLQRCGQAQAALDAMERSIRLAEPGGYIRVHADLGKEILGLLEQIQGRGWRRS